MSDDLIAKLDLVAKRWPVEIACRHAFGTVPEYDSAECARCGGSIMRIGPIVTATGSDLSLIEPDGWPAAPMRAWWGLYGWDLERRLAGWRADTSWTFHHPPPYRPTVAGALWYAAIDALETDR